MDAVPVPSEPVAQPPPEATPERVDVEEPAAPGDAPVKIKTRKPSAETTFRCLFGEQMDLTALADSKANMMIQINGLIMSIMLASSSIILDARPWLRLPCI